MFAGAFKVGDLVFFVGARHTAFAFARIVEQRRWFLGATDFYRVQELNGPLRFNVDAIDLWPARMSFVGPVYLYPSQGP